MYCFACFGKLQQLPACPQLQGGLHESGIPSEGETKQAAKFCKEVKRFYILHSKSELKELIT